MMETKWHRFWHWACQRGFVFLAYVCIAISAMVLYRESPPPPIGADFTVATIASVIALFLILAGLATAHAIVYGLRPSTIFLIKLEVPSLKILSAIIAIHGAIDVLDGDVPGGFVQIGLAILLFHQMRLLSVLRKGPNGGLI